MRHKLLNVLLGKTHGVMGTAAITSHPTTVAAVLWREQAKSRPTARAPLADCVIRGREPRIELPMLTGAVVICDTARVVGEVPLARRSAFETLALAISKN